MIQTPVCLCQNEIVTASPNTVLYKRRLDQGEERETQGKIYIVKDGILVEHGLIAMP